MLFLEPFEKHEGRYGYRRIHAELKTQGYTVNHKKFQLNEETRFEMRKIV
ncbi:IS3 family transposase [Niallia taxi]